MCHFDCDLCLRNNFSQAMEIAETDPDTYIYLFASFAETCTDKEWMTAERCPEGGIDYYCEGYAPLDNFI